MGRICRILHYHPGNVVFHAGYYAPRRALAVRIAVGECAPVLRFVMGQFHANSPLRNSRSRIAGVAAGRRRFPTGRAAVAGANGHQPVVIETLICKYLLQVGSTSGRDIAQHLCLPFGIFEDLLLALRSRQVLVHQGQAALNDYCYALTEQGVGRARAAMQACSYVGPVPVPLDEYTMSVEAQTIRAEPARREQLMAAFRGISIEPELLDLLGPAVNSGAGLFLYGAPGNGKTTLAKRITNCFGQHIWIPRTLTEDGQFIKLYDAACHEAVEESEGSIIKTAHVDTRWVKIRRPTVVVGGELTMDNLEIRHDPRTNVSEASIQLKSNCGCLLIDDFGRQRIDPTDLLNRWIVPLECRHDFLTLGDR